MARRTKASPEKLYGSTLSWEGWTFRVLSSIDGLRRIELAPTPFDQLSSRLKARILPDDEPNTTALDQLHAYLRGELRDFSIDLDIRGTPFQRRVWDTLESIPYGQTVAYVEVAERIGNVNALRAVGQAVGANPIPIVIPCHRVVGKDGRLVGFAGGLPLKERLLFLERGSLSL
ncbi:methylated-DNA--[protein]-cysteine S-methyltransferase [Candidatus Bipolaricaulota bacterium]